MTSTSPVLLHASKATGGVGVSLSLHPLPILTISEHLTRARCQQGTTGHQNNPVRVYGALLGTQNGREVEIHNTFELKVGHAPSLEGEAGPSAAPQVDHTFFRSRQVQFKQTFPSFDFLGWYSNGVEPTEADMNIHKQLLEYSEAPIFLQFSPSNAAILSSSRGGVLPLQLYESQVEMALPSTLGGIGNGNGDSSTASADKEKDAEAAGVGAGAGGARLYFVRSNYKIQTGEAERIAVEYASKPDDGGGDGGDAGAVLASLTTQQSAIRMLSDRIQLVTSYIAAVRQGQAPRDEDILRAVKSILAGMPAMDSEEFSKEFMMEYNDVLLTKLLSSMTKGVHSLNELVDKFELISSSSGAHSHDVHLSTTTTTTASSASSEPDFSSTSLSEKGRFLRERRSRGVHR